MLGEKYVVIKTEDVGEAMETIVRDAALPGGAVLDSIREFMVEDCFVIRAQDLFGPAGLFAYAHTIQTGLEMDRARPGSLTADERERLQALADDVVQLGLDWQRSFKGRVPD